MDQPSVKRRVKAAMVLANVDFPELADRISTRGLGARTLRKLQDENDEREPRPWELELIAQACAVPEWFLKDGWAAAPPARDAAERLRPDEVEAIAQRVVTMIVSPADDSEDVEDVEGAIAVLRDNLKLADAADGEPRRAGAAQPPRRASRAAGRSKR